MTPDAILALAKARGTPVTEERAQLIAGAIAANLSVLQRAPLPFEAEPALYALALEDCAGKAGPGKTGR